MNDENRIVQLVTSPGWCVRHKALQPKAPCDPDFWAERVVCFALMEDGQILPCLVGAGEDGPVSPTDDFHELLEEGRVPEGELD